MLTDIILYVRSLYINNEWNLVSQSFQLAMEFIRSQRGGRLLAFNGYLYRINKTLRETTWWRCVKCGTNMRLVNNQVPDGEEFPNHGHLPDPSEIEVKRRKEAAKQEAIENSLRPMKRRYSDLLHADDDDENTTSKLPCFRNIRSTLYRHRASILPNLPANRGVLHLDGVWTQTLNGRPFVLAQDGGDDKIIIFATTNNISLLCRCSTILMDGTFKSSPRLFAQLYTIHGRIYETTLRLAYCLLPAKDEHTYERVFRLLQIAATQMGLQLQPQTIQIDFEMASFNAIRTCFPMCRLRGCLFHYAQAIWRKIQDLGLVVRYRDDPAFNRLVRRCFGLPFIPPNYIDEVWMEALEEVVNDDVVDNFKDYITQTWVDNIVARFPNELWTHADNIGIHLPRTNNSLESWHGLLNRKLTAAHPNVFRIVQLLQEEQKDTEQLVRLLETGNTADPQRRKHLRITQKLEVLEGRFERQEITAYHFAGAAGALLNT